MPTRFEWVPPALVLFHRGVGVFHAYVDDDIDQGPTWYSFTLDSSTDEKSFDVRELVIPGEERLALTGSTVADNNLAIRAYLRRAIDAGVLTVPHAVSRAPDRPANLRTPEAPGCF